MNKALIIFLNNNIDIESAYKSLTEYSLAVKWDSQERLSIMCGDWNANIFIEIYRGEEAQDEIYKVSDGSEYEPYLNECDAFFAISFDNFEEVLDEINTLIDVTNCLQELTKGFLYYSWNQNISPPDENN